MIGDDKQTWPPGWVNGYPGLEHSLRSCIRILNNVEGNLSTQHSNTEFKEEAEQIIGLAKNLHNKMQHLHDKSSDRFIIGNHKRDAIDKLKAAFKDGWQPGQTALDNAVIGTDVYSMQWALAGLQFYLRELIEEGENSKRSDNEDYKKNVVDLIVTTIIRAGMLLGNNTAKKYDEAIVWVFELAGTAVPSDSVKIRNRHKGNPEP